MRVYPFAIAAALYGAPALAAPPIEGLWINEDRNGVVRIGRCGAHMCGWLAQVLDRGPNAPTNDIHNPDPRLRSRPVIGVPIFTGLSGSGGRWSGGRGYDPRSGQSFAARLSLNADGSLGVTGCRLVVLCRTWRWTRAP